MQWEGYGREEDSWEPEKNLLTCQEIVDKYWDEQKQLDKDQRNIQATDQQKRRSGRPVSTVGWSHVMWNELNKRFRFF